MTKRTAIQLLARFAWLATSTRSKIRTLPFLSLNSILAWSYMILNPVKNTRSQSNNLALLHSLFKLELTSITTLFILGLSLHKLMLLSFHILQPQPFNPQQLAPGCLLPALLAEDYTSLAFGDAFAYMVS